MNDLFGFPVKVSDRLSKAASDITLGDWTAYMRISVRGCARCGQNHDNLEFHPLTRAMSDSEGQWTHWAACPTNGEPILMKVQETARPVGPSEYKGRWHE